jgi:hypothetical protein
MFLVVQISEWPLHLWPRRLVVIAVVASLIFVPLAAMAGAWQYKEEGSAAA